SSSSGRGAPGPRPGASGAKAPDAGIEVRDHSKEDPRLGATLQGARWFRAPWRVAPKREVVPRGVRRGRSVLLWEGQRSFLDPLTNGVNVLLREARGGGRRHSPFLKGRGERAE